MYLEEFFEVDFDVRDEEILLRNNECYKLTSNNIKVNIIGMGDVGRNLAIGLRLLGGQDSIIKSIGLFDMNNNLLRALEMEISQINALDFMKPKIEVLSQDKIFDCDVFVFAASKSVPKEIVDNIDPRMSQYLSNKELVKEFALRAFEEGYKGEFIVLSDPVDLLAMDVIKSGLNPSNVRGMGLGVMYARALYYGEKLGLKKDEIRVYGPHGKGLIAINSLINLNSEISYELTKYTEEANLRIRDLGYKPFLGPAFSSGVLSILKFLKGEFHHSSVYVGGCFFGCLNKKNTGVNIIHREEIPEKLGESIKKTLGYLKGFN